MLSLVDGEKNSDARISVRLNFRGRNSRSFPTLRLYVALQLGRSAHNRHTSSFAVTGVATYR